MSDKEKIKEEIERLLKENKHNQHNDSIQESLDKASKCRLLYELKKFIDSLPEEHNEDLEEEIIKIWKDSEDNGNLFELGKLRIIARHFAEWQRKKDQETIELAEDHAMLAGMNKMKEEMMKDAVDATIFSELKGSNGSLFQAKTDRFKMNSVKISDKIKVIPIKN